MSGIELVELLTAVWLLILAVIAVARILRGNGHASLVLTCVHFVFFGIPLLLDRVGNVGEITRYPGFLAALESDRVRLAYCGVVAAAPLIWQSVGRPGRWSRRDSPALPRPVRPLEYVLLFAPAVLAIAANNWTTLRTYGIVAQDVLDDEALYWSHSIGLTSLLVVATVGGILARKTPLNMLQQGILFMATFGALWLNGKRAIIAMAALWFGYALWRRSLVPAVRALHAGAAGIGIVVAMLIGYQWYVRGIAISDERQLASNRVDYGRDLVLRQTLLPELEQFEPPVLEFRGQSFLFYATLPIPRSLWPEKPWPYAVYQTSRMLNIQPRPLGWGITTSWLDECVANLGWFGVFVGPFVLGLICRIGHGRRDSETDAATVLLAVLLLTVQAAAFIPIVLVWMTLALRARSRREGGVLLRCACVERPTGRPCEQTSTVVALDRVRDYPPR